MPLTRFVVNNNQRARETLLARHDQAAAEPIAGIARRIGGMIVHTGVDDQRAPVAIEDRRRAGSERDAVRLGRERAGERAAS